MARAKQSPTASLAGSRGACVLRLEERGLSALLYLSDDSFEGFRMIDCEVSEDLAVDLDTLSVESTHQARVREPFETSSSVDTLDPEGAEVTLLVLTIAESVGQTLFPSVLGYGPDVLASTIVPTRELKDALALSARSYMID